MALVLNGTTGITSVNGSAAAPSVTGADTDTGIVYGTNTLSLATGGTTAVTVDSSQNVGIGTSSPAYALHAQRGAGVASYIGAAGNNNDLTTSGLIFGQDTSGLSRIFQFGANPMTFWTNGSERARIDSSGNLLVGTTSQVGAGQVCSTFDQAAKYGVALKNSNATSTGIFAGFYNSGGTLQGYISQTNSTTTAYATSSDYRLKSNPQPMTGALEKVTSLKPCTYTWKADGSTGQGFIAHELQEIVPECVIGQKDAVDADGNPVYQGIDTSFLVATLTAAIQELKAELDAAKADIAALKAPQ